MILLEKRLVGRRIVLADVCGVIALEFRAKRRAVRVVVWLVHDRPGVLKLPRRGHIEKGVLL